MVIVTGPRDSRTLRLEWGRSLAEHLDARGWSRKQLLVELDRIGYPTTHQAVSSWINGRTSPRPPMQAALAQVLQVPHRSLFPVPTVSVAS